ncbi:hypothetical protein M427DRAFT_300566 [Gonapodya prolifera JEL478]|uniref:Xylanolytic transcriptional activator regulatory domain-containing protein n=1 Tax=Gonapodya prolifera (strain JEL478) TaxID=1344416 RepID=A0A139AH02_GONPJ|nr:hypothetical protein M427DRAFT_300566 [Gonapodya prolifera JEL478]|eukprot:KXS16091.1 hypothetical protein M427DRAFT_300566 [Gonapodya prolifera JEL478]
MNGTLLMELQLSETLLNPLSHFNSALAYSLIGICVTKSRELGLHVDPNMASHVSTGSKDWILTEERRRTGWAVYVVDRMAALTHARSPILLDQEYCLSHPCSDELWQGNPFALLQAATTASSPTSSDAESRDAAPSLLELYMVRDLC